MDWLRCNVCYRPMKKSKRAFSLTQCGHLYCSQCIIKVAKKCPECGAENFTSMPLAYPPKLETVHNYFAPLDEFMEICLKTEAFQSNQWGIVMRGFKEIEIKYENMKRSYWAGMKEMKSLIQAFQKLQAEQKDLEATRNSFLKSMEAQNSRISRSGRSFSAHPQVSQCQRIPEFSPMSGNLENSRTSELPRFHDEQCDAARFPMSSGYSENARLQTPYVAYDQRTPIQSKSFRSGGCATDSGVSSSGRTDVFRVPSGGRVPKSAALAKRKTPTDVRHIRANNGFNS